MLCETEDLRITMLYQVIEIKETGIVIRNTYYLEKH